MKNTRTFALIFIIILSLVPSAIPIAQAQDSKSGSLFLNGDFEETTVEISTFLPVTDNSILSDWVLVSNSIDIVAEYWLAASGTHSIDLNGSSPGAIQQTIETSVGQTYELRFALSGDGSSTPNMKTMRVEITGQPEPFPFSVDVTGNTTQNMNWQYQTISFTATEPITTITFASETVEVAGPALDDVSLVENVAAEPTIVAVEPTSVISEFVFNPDNGSYYLVVQEDVSWEDANQAIQVLTHEGCPGHLATINTLEENQFLIDNGLTGFYWLGGIQNIEENDPNGGWQWITGEPFTYASWGNGEPNGQGNEPRINMWGAESLWNDHPGGAIGEFVPGPVGYLVEFECSFQFNPTNGNYYRAVEGELTWTQANEASNALTYENCAGHLATITSQAETDFLLNSAIGDVDNSSIGSYWLGGFQASDADEGADGKANWQWVTGETWSHTNWLSYEPNVSFADNEDFLEFRNIENRGDRGQWNDAPDIILGGYIVEFDCSSQVESVNSAVAASELCSPGSDQAIEVDVVNQTTQTLTFIWMSFDCQERLPGGVIEPGATRTEGTFVGHIFILRNEAGEIVRQFTVEQDMTEIMIGN